MKKKSVHPGWKGYRSLGVALVFSVRLADAQSFPDRVVSFTPGPNAGFGSGYFPGNVLGPPNGNANPQTPTFTEADLLSFGTGGSIVLEFTTTEVVDAAGPDLIIFENPVQPSHDPTQSFVDSAVVAVSSDGQNWTQLAFNIVSTDREQLVYKSNYVGFAGVMPSLSSPSNGLSPFDPQKGGGDAFDLAPTGLSSVRFVRITDTGTTSVATTVDPDGQIVNDYGNLIDPNPLQPGSGISAGFDLDAVAAIHSVARVVTSARREEWQLYE